MADTLATLTTPRANTTLTTDITVQAREVDFVSRFSQSWEALREILSIMDPVRKDPGTKLTSYKAAITLEDGNVPEGAVIPYSKARVEPVAYDDLTLRKYAKAVTIEDVNKYGAAVAVQRTDDAFLNELQSEVLDEFYQFMLTGTLTSTESTFQKAVAMAIGRVKHKFKEMHLNFGKVAVFANILDAYNYLGSAEITVQSAFGIQYIEKFMGADVVILTSEIPEGTVVGIPSDNIVLYYVDPGDGDFAQLGLNYTVDGETNLIGFHANGNYSTAVGESYAVMGLKMWAEYLDAIAVITIAQG